MGMIWLSLSRWGISKSLNPALIKLEFCLISSLRCSDFFAISIALIEAAAILGFAEEVKIKPGAKLLMKSIMSELAAT